MRDMFLHLLRGVVLMVLVGATIPRGAEAAPLGFGAIGDSLGDEYEFVPGPRNGARNYVELLATLRGLDFGTFSSADRGEPRNQGYENNWANVGNLTPHGVTTGDLIPLGQV